MPITSQQQADIITDALMEIRPAWNRAKILDLLRDNRANPTPFGLILQACITYANDPAKQTPQFLFQDGKHWAAGPGSPVTTRPADPCVDHPQEAAHNCRCCRADVLVGLRPQAAIGRHHDIPTT